LKPCNLETLKPAATEFRSCIHYGTEGSSYGFRLGYTKPWKSRWFVEKDYDKLLLEDYKLKTELKEKLKSAGVSAVEIERPGNKLRIIIKTARPGIIIGRKARKSTS